MPGDRHAFDQDQGIALHHHAVGEGAGVAFVRIADDVLLAGRRVQHGLPLNAGRERRAAPPAQPGLRYRFDDGSRRQLERAAQPAVAAVGFVVVDRDGIGDADAGKRQPLLPREVRDFLRLTEEKAM